MNSRLQTGSATTPGGSDIYGQLFQVCGVEEADGGGDRDRSLTRSAIRSSVPYSFAKDQPLLRDRFGGSRIVTGVAGEGKRGFAREEALSILVGPGRCGTPEPTRDR
ncbi:unnamed protein product [Musa textilis]